MQILSAMDELKSGGAFSGRTKDLHMSVRQSLNGSSNLFSQHCVLHKVPEPLAHMQKLGEKQKDPQAFHPCWAPIKRGQPLQDSGHNLFGNIWL